MPPARRGRPLKFGRPGQTVTLTLPHDVLEWLGSLNDDPAWAIVTLFERRQALARAPKPKSVAELVQLPGKRSLILVRPDVLKFVPGVSIVPLSDGRAFIALEPGKGVADLELALLDRSDASGVGAEERKQLLEFRRLLRTWRQEGLRFQPRSILVVERSAVAPPRPLSTLATTG